MQGHIYCTSDLEIYYERSKELFNCQKGIFKQLGSKFDSFVDLTNDTSLTWFQRNIRLHDFYHANLCNLSNQVNPSMIFHISPSYKFDQDIPRVNIQITTKSFENIDISRRTMALILYNSGFRLRTNYKNSEGVCSQIIKHIEELEIDP